MTSIPMPMPIRAGTWAFDPDGCRNSAQALANADGWPVSLMVDGRRVFTAYPKAA